MICHGALAFLPLFLLLGVAAAIDLRSRRIPNWLIVAMATAGLAQSLTAAGAVPPLGSCLGLLAGVGLSILPFAIGARGGGDVKLLAAAGTWIGPLAVLHVFLAASVVGLAIVLGQCAWRGRLKVLFRNSYLLILNFLNVRQLGWAHVCATGQACRSVDRPLPYAVPMLIATVGVLLLGRGG